MENNPEIDQIQRELALLRGRYALYGWWARILRGFFIYLMPVVALGCALGAFLFDSAYGLFLLGMGLVVAAIAALSMESFGIRWIDVASQYGFPGRDLGIFNPYFFYPDAAPAPRSDAEFLERQIADRERRLSELESASYSPH
jgi:hypothetical protein